jgi:hypothetical protein
VVAVRRVAIVFALVVGLLTLASSASARQVLHTTADFSGHFRNAAGTVCDFNEKEVFSGHDNIVIVGDPDNPDETTVHEEIQVTHINLDTGYTLSEVDQYTVHFDRDDGRFKTTGLVWHLRNPEGKLVVVQAGLQLFDANTAELLKVTPAINPNFGEVICPALGGRLA